MANKPVAGYVDIIGKHGLAVYDHTGPASYVQWVAPSTGGDVVTAQSLGLRSVDTVHAQGADTTGVYNVRLLLTGTGQRTSFIVVWYVLATGAQVAAGTNLSGIIIRLEAIGG